MDLGAYRSKFDRLGWDAARRGAGFVFTWDPAKGSLLCYSEWVILWLSNWWIKNDWDYRSLNWLCNGRILNNWRWFTSNCLFTRALLCLYYWPLPLVGVNEHRYWALGQIALDLNLEQILIVLVNQQALLPIFPLLLSALTPVISAPLAAFRTQSKVCRGLGNSIN